MLAKSLSIHLLQETPDQNNVECKKHYTKPPNRRYYHLFYPSLIYVYDNEIATKIYKLITKRHRTEIT